MPSASTTAFHSHNTYQHSENSLRNKSMFSRSAFHSSYNMARASSHFSARSSSNKPFTSIKIATSYHPALTHSVQCAPLSRHEKGKYPNSSFLLSARRFDLRLGLKRHPHYTPAPASDRQGPDAVAAPVVTVLLHRHVRALLHRGTIPFIRLSRCQAIRSSIRLMTAKKTADCYVTS